MLGPDAADELETVHVGKLDIGEEKVKGLVLPGCSPRRCVRDHGRLMSFHLDEPLERPAHIVVVVDHQDAERLFCRPSGIVMI